MPLLFAYGINRFSHDVANMSYVVRKPVFCHVNNKGADKPVHPRSVISAFVVRGQDRYKTYSC